MSRETLLEEIMNTISEVTDIDVDEMEEESSLMDDLELSSLEVMNVFAELEEQFEMKFSQNDMREIDTISDIAECILKNK